MKPQYVKVADGTKRMPLLSGGRLDGLTNRARSAAAVHGSQVAVSYYRTDRVVGENTPPPGGFGPDVANKMSDYVLAGGSELNAPYPFEVLSPRFPPPDDLQAGFNGDYSGISVDRNNLAHPIWSDTRNQALNPTFDKVTVDEDVFTEARPIPRR